MKRAASRSPLLPVLLALAFSLLAPPSHAELLLPQAPRGGELPWASEPTGPIREVLVLPILLLEGVPGMETTGFLGERPLPGEGTLRLERARQLRTVPELLSVSIPGELARGLPPEWMPHLRAASQNPRALRRLARTLERGDSPEALMRRIAARVDEDAVLFQWIQAIRLNPLCATEVPRSTTEVAGRLVFIDDRVEPVLVEATLGMALVRRDGDIVLRYQDTYETVLSEATSVQRACRELARAFLDDLKPALSWNRAEDEPGAAGPDWR
jgi:hypothetical protein